MDRRTWCLLQEGWRPPIVETHGVTGYPASDGEIIRDGTLGTETAEAMDEQSERDGAGPARRRPVQVPPGRNVSPPTVPDRYRYSIAELEEQTGFSSRTIRYYVSKALLPPAHGRGPTATYDLSHLLRLRAIQRRRQEGVLLEEIKAELNDLSDKQIADMLEVRTDLIEDRWRRICSTTTSNSTSASAAGSRVIPASSAAVEQIVKLARVVVDDLDRDRNE